MNILTGLEKIGKQFKELRLQLGLSIEEFAEQCNLPPETIEQIEAGKKEDLDTNMLVTVAYYLGQRIHIEAVPVEPGQ